MKNLHVVPTSKPNRGYILGKCIKELSDTKLGEFIITNHLIFSEEFFEPHIIYITSDELIKEGDWTYANEIFKNIEVGEYVKTKELQTYPYDWCKKIILTTDQDLIDDGVQAISYEFLLWFIKNSSCEKVETKYETLWFNKRFGGCWQPFPDESATIRKKVYEIINLKVEYTTDYTSKHLEYCGIIAMESLAKDEQKQHLTEMMRDDENLGLYDYTKKSKMYNEEEVYSLIKMVAGMKDGGKTDIEIVEYFEKYKKK